MPVWTESETEAPPPETKTQPQRERSGLLSKTPWPRGRTRNSAPLEDDRLILDNQTFNTWHVYVGFHDLGMVAPQQRVTQRVVKSGQLSARPMDAPVGATYLTGYLRPAVHTVEIRSQVIGNDLTFDLRLVENGK
jgi:hypothetical protein